MPHLPLVPERRFAGRALIVVACLLWSLSGAFGKDTAFHAWPEEQRGILLAFWRALFAGLALAPAVRRPRWRWGMLPMALAFALMNAAYLSAMTLTTAANAIWLQGTAPFWICLFSLVVFRKRPDRREWVPLVACALGIGLILGFELGGQEQVGVFCGLASGVFYAMVLMSLRALREEESAWLVALNHLVTAALTFPIVIYLDLWPSGGQWPRLVAFGALQMGLPYWLFARGLKQVSTQEAALIGLLEPVLMPLWPALLWGESPAWWTLSGAAVILAGLAWRYGAELWERRKDKGGTMKALVV